MQPKPEFLNPDDFPEPHMESAARVSEAERLALEIDGERYGDVAAELRRLAAEVEALREALTTIYHQANEAHPSEWGLCVAAIESRAKAAIDAAKAKESSNG